MADESRHKLQDRQSHNLFHVGIVIKVLKGNRSAIVALDSCFTDRGALEIFAKILNIGFHAM